MGNIVDVSEIENLEKEIQANIEKLGNSIVIFKKRAETINKLAKALKSIYDTTGGELHVKRLLDSEIDDSGLNTLYSDFTTIKCFHGKKLVDLGKW